MYISISKVVLLTAMEFLRDEDFSKIEALTSKDKAIFYSGADSETRSRLEDPAVELETAEAWPDHQDGNNEETSSKRLRWLRITGENRKYFQYCQ